MVGADHYSEWRPSVPPFAFCLPGGGREEWRGGEGDHLLRMLATSAAGCC